MLGTGKFFRNGQANDTEERNDITVPSSMYGAKVIEIPLDEIRPNPSQPRKIFDEPKIDELAASIKEVGLIQPIVVKLTEDGYELIVGERRFRAARKAGLEKIPALVQDVNASEQRLMALMENIHRSDLSSVEEALSLKDILDKTGWNQSELADKLGRSQSSIANKLRLLKLEEPVQQLVLSGKLGERQARALVALPSKEQIVLAEKAVEDDISAKRLETMAKSILRKSENIGGHKGKNLHRLPKAGILPFSGPEGPTGDLLKELALIVEGSRQKGVPVLWKVRQIAQNELVVEIKVELAGKPDAREGGEYNL